MIFPSTQLLTEKYLYFFEDHQAVRLTLEMFSTCTQDFLSELAEEMKSTAGDLSLHFLLLKLRLEIFLLIFLPMLFLLRMDRSFLKPIFSIKESVQQ